MRTIETSISVNSDGSAVIELQLSGNVPAGVHRAVVIVEEQPAAAEQLDTPVNLLPLAFEGWPQDCTFRREDLYGDDGR
jgi:hypothetical protein